MYFYFSFPLNILFLEYIHVAKCASDFILYLFAVGQFYWVHLTQSIFFWQWTFGLFPDLGSSDRCYRGHLCAHASLGAQGTSLAWNYWVRECHVFSFVSHQTASQSNCTVHTHQRLGKCTMLPGKLGVVTLAFCLEVGVKWCLTVAVICISLMP